jgi:hypothetical protein
LTKADFIDGLTINNLKEELLTNNYLRSMIIDVVQSPSVLYEKEVKVSAATPQIMHTTRPR